MKIVSGLWVAALGVITNVLLFEKYNWERFRIIFVDVVII